MLIPNGTNTSWEELEIVNKKFDKPSFTWCFKKDDVFKKLMPSRVMSFEGTFLYVECCGKL